MKDKPTMFCPQCQDPLLLVNPRALFLYQQGGVVNDSPIPSGVRAMNVDKKALLRHAYRELLLSGDKRNYRLLEHYYVEHLGQFEFLYTVVGCGKCWICSNTKRLDLVSRAALESEMYETPPIFITLTYDDDHLPRNGSIVSYNLRYSDIQKFFKRLRKRFASKGLSTDFRYLVAGEYGKQTHRPHYHILLWNNPYMATEMMPYSWNQLAADVFYSWGKCSPAGFDFQQCSGGAARYVTKYLTKQVHYKDRDVQPFIHSSIGNGGIGRKRLQMDSGFYQDNPSLIKFQYYSTKTGNVEEISFGSYAKSVLHPSPSRMINPSQRDLYNQLCDIFSVLVSYGLYPFDAAWQFLEFFRPYKSVLPHKLRQYQVEALPCPTFCDLLAKRLLNAAHQLTFQLHPSFDVTAQDLAAYQAYLRHQVDRVCDFDLTTKAFRIASQFAVDLNRETL